MTDVPQTYPPRSVQLYLTIRRVVEDLPPDDRQEFAAFIAWLKENVPVNISEEYAARALKAFWRGLPRLTVAVVEPYPADLVKAPQQSTAARADQIRTLVIVLVWLMAIIVPIVQQRLSAEAQLVTDAEVGTISLALAITALMKQGRK